jgi:hypothetical protein
MESFVNIDMYSRLLTFAISMMIGFDLSKSMPRPKSINSWLVIILLVIIAGYIGMDVKLISIFGYTLFLNEAILGLSSGLVLGLALRIRPKFKAR